MGATTYHGSCACGKTRIEATLDLANGTFKCNCTMCTKSRMWGAMVKPDALKVVAGEADLATYSSGAEHRFCRHCGVKLFGRGSSPEAGGEFVAINLGVLDDLSPEEWARAPVRYMDGRHDQWMREPEFTGHM